VLDGAYEGCFEKNLCAAQSTSTSSDISGDFFNSNRATKEPIANLRANDVIMVPLFFTEKTSLLVSDCLIVEHRRISSSESILDSDYCCIRPDFYISGVISTTRYPVSDSLIVERVTIVAVHIDLHIVIADQSRRSKLAYAAFARRRIDFTIVASRRVQPAKTLRRPNRRSSDVAPSRSVVFNDRNRPPPNFSSAIHPIPFLRDRIHLEELAAINREEAEREERRPPIPSGFCELSQYWLPDDPMSTPEPQPQPQPHPPTSPIPDDDDSVAIDTYAVLRSAKGPKSWRVGN
jgi:hypothetical protein